MNLGENIQIPSIVERAKEDKWLHVFLITNPVTIMVARMIIDSYQIDRNRIVVALMRQSDTSMIGVPPIIPNEYWYDRYVERVAGVGLKGRRILKEIKKEEFIVYAAWADSGVQRVLKSKYCRGHVYIEEGQMSYWNILPYSSKDFGTLGKLVSRSHARACEDRVDLYRDDALAFIGMLPCVFPLAPEERCFILNNYKNLKEHYNPALTGVKMIGLTCSTRRLQPDQWSEMFIKLIDKMPGGGVIKLHPSFFINAETRRVAQLTFDSIAPRDIKLCSDGIMIEMEMLYEPKILVGPLTSLSRYANAFGSNFIHVDLY